MSESDDLDNKEDRDKYEHEDDVLQKELLNEPIIQNAEHEKASLSNSNQS